MLSYLPEHTWALNIRYGHGATSIGLTINGTGALYRSYDETYYALTTGNIRLNSDRASMSGGSAIFPAKGYATADFNASHRLMSNTEAVLQIHNLTDYYRNDSDPASAILGRQTKAGLRFRF
jgi:hypothetical protein